MLALIAALPLALALPGFAGEPAPCVGLPPVPAEDPAFADGVFLRSPLAGEVVPRNVVLVLGGTLFLLDGEAPTYRVSLFDESGASVATERRGDRLYPTDLLLSDHEYAFLAEPTEHHGCPDCVFVEQRTFHTGPEVDLAAPPPAVPEAIDLSIGLDGCGGPTSGILRVEMPLTEDARFLDVALALERALPRQLAAFTTFLDEPPRTLLFPLSSDTVFVDDEAVVAFTATDVAGNVSVPHVLRVRAWDAFSTTAAREKPAPDLTCLLPPAPVVEGATLLPRNGQIVVRFPFEPFALSLETEGGLRIPLYEEDQAGPLLQVLRPLDDPPAGVPLRLVVEPCAACVCPGCAIAPETTVQLTDLDDEQPPPPPVLRDVRYVPSPPSQSGGVCQLDRAYVEARLEGEAGDAVAYHASLKRPGAPRVVLDRYVQPLEEEGARLVRFSARGLEELLTGTWALEVTAVDAAGHTSTAAFVRPDLEPPGGCGGNHAVAPSRAGALAGLAAVFALAAAGRRRRGASRVGNVRGDPTLGA